MKDHISSLMDKNTEDDLSCDMSIWSQSSGISGALWPRQHSVSLITWPKGQKEENPYQTMQTFFITCNMQVHETL